MRKISPTSYHGYGRVHITNQKFPCFSTRPVFNMDFEIALSHRTQGLWLAFISDPIKKMPARGWNSYEPDGNSVEFGKDGRLVGSIGFDELGRVCNGVEPIPGAMPSS